MASVEDWTPDPATGRPRYRARWRTPEGKPRSKVFAKKAAATAHGVNMESAKLTGSYIDPGAGRITFKEYAESWLELQVGADSTRDSTRARLRKAIDAFGHMPIGSIEPSTVRRWISNYDGAASTAKVALVNVSQVFSAAVEDGKRATNPCKARSVKAPPVPEREVVPFTDDEVYGIIDAVPDLYRALVVLYVGCGLRQSEGFGLAVKDVDFLGRWVHVNRQLYRGRLQPPKGGKVRRVPLPQWVGDALAEHLVRFPVADRGALVFTNDRGDKIDHSTFNRKVWKPALVAVGVDDTLRENGCHRCRHTFASNLLHDGESVPAVAKWMGDTDVVVMRTYSHVIPAAEDRTRRLIDARFSTSRVTTVSREARDRP
jgi:integrase